jgi:hypothetical protein
LEKLEEGKPVDRLLPCSSCSKFFQENKYKWVLIMTKSYTPIHIHRDIIGLVYFVGSTRGFAKLKNCEEGREDGGRLGRDW